MGKKCNMKNQWHCGNVSAHKNVCLNISVVDSILKGVDVGITPRRRACNNKDHDTSHQSNNTAVSQPTYLCNYLSILF